jgi:hypothetical protein
MSTKASPFALRVRASRCWCTVSFRLRPKRTPLAWARFRPSLVRARIKWRSNSASPPRTVSINRPCGVAVSAQGSPSDLKLAPALPITSRVLRRSRVDHASRSRLVTIRQSPSARAAIALASCWRSVLAPLAFSLNTRSAPLSRRAACCASSVCPSVLTLAYPTSSFCT